MCVGFLQLCDNCTHSHKKRHILQIMTIPNAQCTFEAATSSYRSCCFFCVFTFCVMIHLFYHLFYCQIHGINTLYTALSLLLFMAKANGRAKKEETRLHRNLVQHLLFFFSLDTFTFLLVTIFRFSLGTYNVPNDQSKNNEHLNKKIKKIWRTHNFTFAINVT